MTILGAGDMGTALVTPLVQNNHSVRLWATDRDDGIASAFRAGGVHPRLGIGLPEGADIFTAEQAGAALEGVDFAVVAITSDGVREVVGRLAKQLQPVPIVVTVAKGFDCNLRDEIQLLPVTIREFTAAPVVAVGGPSKANEVAFGQPTAVVFGSLDRDALERCRSLFTTPVYRVAATDDIVGLEMVAAMKNAYAIALGVTDGLEQRTGSSHHNLRAALFPRAVEEMASLAEAAGGRAETALGLAGAGDLQVTITSGRNRQLGERIGTGQPAADAMRELTAAGKTIEGYAATNLGYRLYRQWVANGTIRESRLPLLDALWRIVYRGAIPAATLWGAC